MSDRIVSITERTLTTTVDNIEHIESQSLNGIAVVKVFFQRRPISNAQLHRSRLFHKLSFGNSRKEQRHRW